MIGKIDPRSMLVSRFNDIRKRNAFVQPLHLPHTKWFSLPLHERAFVQDRLSLPQRHATMNTSSKCLGANIENEVVSKDDLGTLMIPLSNIKLVDLDPNNEPHL